jgi:hypothetical protein
VGEQLVPIVASQGDVEEILVVAELTKRRANVLLEIVPAEAELLRPHLGGVGGHRVHYRYLVPVVN